ncbi:hypothetical protein VPH35_047761 [Triticum aestivum]|nr:F-box protein FBW2-like isoform X2 [Triticum aestivum]XP_044337917.1 F-box protein FBW2-like isoform X2 [Triticum aestivum]
MVGPGSEGSRMEEYSEDRCWEDLARGALGIIFCKLSLQEILTVVLGICKPWSRVVSGPDCWQDIDIQEWSQQSEPDKITSMVHMLLSRSAGSCHRLSVSRLPNDSLFAFIADHAQSLKTLEISRSEISDGIVEDVAQRLTKVTFLDVSGCTKIGARALEAFGKNCKSLVRLRRVMHPMDVAGKVSHNDEARAIPYNMPKLCHLDIGYMLIGTTDVVEIASQCQDLKFLDLRGCWDVDDKILQEKYPGLKILGPRVNDCYENSFWDECSDDDSIYSWEEFTDDDYFVIESDDEAIWDHDHSFEGLEVRFYGGVFGEGFAGFDWPESP